MAFKNPFKRKDNLFKEINKQTKAEVKEIKKISDPVEKLARYKALEEKFPTLYGEGQVQEAVNRMNDLRGDITDERVRLGMIGVGTSLLIVIATFSAPPLCVALIASIMALTVSAMAITPHQFYRSYAKDMNLKTRDVKFIVKTKHLEKKAGKAAKPLPLAIEAKKEMDKLRGTFKGVAGPAVAGEAQTVVPAVANKPIALKL